MERGVRSVVMASDVSSAVRVREAADAIRSRGLASVRSVGPESDVRENATPVATVRTASTSASATTTPRATASRAVATVRLDGTASRATKSVPRASSARNAWNFAVVPVTPYAVL